MSFISKKVNVVLSINQEEVDRNIMDNLRNIPVWFGELFYPNGYEAIIVSAGPSMEKYVEQLNLRERMKDPKRSFVVFAVKHALPRLLKMGVEPDFCVLLDGRDFEGESTHGINRKTLFDNIPQKTVFMVASMSHKGYAEYLLTHGARVLGWHTAVTGIEKFRDSGHIREPIISGGTSSGTRCIGIANAMGIREISLVGFDSCIHNPTEEQLKELDHKKRVKYMPVDLPIMNPKATPEQQQMINFLEQSFRQDGLVYSAGLQKRFYTTGELLAQSQDFEAMFANTQYDMQFKVFDDGIVNHMFANMPNILRRSFSFVEYVKNICPRKDYSDVVKKELVLNTPLDVVK